MNDGTAWRDVPATARSLPPRQLITHSFMIKTSKDGNNMDNYPPNIGTFIQEKSIECTETHDCSEKDNCIWCLYLSEK